LEVLEDWEIQQVPKPPRQSMAWMVVFTDLVSLMLTFFVLIFSMSSVKMDKWKEMTDALSQNLNPSFTKSVATATAKFNISTIFRKRAINLDYLTAVLERAVNQDPLLKRSLLMRLEDRLIIALPGDLLFQPGRAVMTERARDALFTLGGVLRNIGNQIGVNGHSDPVPPQGGEYASNWELSIARAVAVTNALKRSGYTEDIIAYGYSDSLYSQLPDVTEEQKQAMGRRVDIMVLPNVGD
jgi:chemotaxis protein MotB